MIYSRRIPMVPVFALVFSLAAVLILSETVSAAPPPAASADVKPVGAAVPAPKPPAPETGLSASLALGGLWMNSNSELMVTDDNRDAGLGDKNRYNRYLPAVLLDLKYTFDSGAQVYAGTPMEGDELIFKIGAGAPIDGLGRMDLYVAPGLFGQVWEDPYLTSGRREDTEKTEWTVGAEWDRIVGTGAKVTYRYVRTDIDNDVIGARFESLQRDGHAHSLEAEYAFPLKPGLMVAPTVGYSRGIPDGEANRYHSTGVGLVLKRFTPQYFGLIKVGASQKNFDETHPIFGETREEIGYGGFALLTWFNPLDRKNWFVTSAVGYFRTEANIDFFDTSTSLVLLTVGYRF